MSGSPRSRQKRKLEPISLEELAGTTGMSGFCTFLTRDSSVPVPALDHLDGIETGAPEMAASEVPASEVGALRSTAPLMSEASALGSLPPISGAPEVVASPSPTIVLLPETAVAMTPAPSAVESGVILGALDLDALESGPPISSALECSAWPSSFLAPDVSTNMASEPRTPDSSGGDLAALDLTALESTASELDARELPALDSFRRRRIRIREVATVQDAHSLAEQAVYDAMYREGKPYQGDSRVLTIGLRTLAEISRMAYSNCKANVRSLVTKLAIDERPGFSYTEGRTYVVYSFREILRRRKAAGLTHVVRTRGVAFVDPRSGQEITPSYHTNLSAPESTAPLSDASVKGAAVSISGAPQSPKTSAPMTGGSGAPVSETDIRDRHLTRNTAEEWSSAPAAIVSALRRYASDVDDEAASQLWQSCLENTPDAKPDEIAHFIHLKGGKTGIRTPLGFLLTAVPKCFIGDSLRQFRDERARAAQSSASRDRQLAVEVLKNPEADDEQRQWAREVLGRENQ